MCASGPLVSFVLLDVHDCTGNQIWEAVEETFYEIFDTRIVLFILLT